jgi:putative copper resistance protein D
MYGTTLAAGVGALTFGLWAGGNWPQSRVTQLLSADVVTAWGTPLSRLAVDVSAVVTIGMLVTVLLLPRAAQAGNAEGGAAEGGTAAAVVRRCLRGAAWSAVAWSAATFAMLLFTWSEVTAVPVTRLPFTQILGEAGAVLPEAEPYLFCALLALVIAAAAAMTRTRRGTVIVLVLAGYNLLPLTTQGHADHSPIVAYALTVHVVALSLWVGGLTGFLVHLRRSAELLAAAVPRFSTLALGCFAAVAASGVAMAWANLGSPAELWRSRYGLLLLCKATALVAIGVLGWWHRRRTVRALVDGRGRHAFVRLAATEVVLMAAAVALGVALASTATPSTTTDPHTHAAGTHAPGHSGPVANAGIR